MQDSEYKIPKYGFFSLLQSSLWWTSRFKHKHWVFVERGKLFRHSLKLLRPERLYWCSVCPLSSPLPTPPQVSGKQSDRTGTIRKHGASVRFSWILQFLLMILHLSHVQQDISLKFHVFQVQQTSRAGPMPCAPPCQRVIPLSVSWVSLWGRSGSFYQWYIYGSEHKVT